MEMHQVRYFLAVARILNFTRAAEECNVTQPSLTRAIQKLEDELGGLLFHRERSLTHLTDLGRLMLPHLERTHEAAKAAKALAQSIGKAQVSPLHIGIARALPSFALDGVLREVGESLPGLELMLTVESSEHLVDLALKGELDLIVIAAVKNASPRLDSWPLFRQPYHLVTSALHPLTRRQRVSMTDLCDVVWIAWDADATALLNAAARGAGFEPDIRHRVNSIDHAIGLIRLGLGSALLALPDGSHPDLAMLMIEDAPMRCEFALSSIAGRPRGIAADTFVRVAKAATWPMTEHLGHARKSLNNVGRLGTDAEIRFCKSKSHD